MHYPPPPKVPYLRLTKYVRPDYPQAALASRAKGIVVVQFTVDCAGAVVDPVVVRSDPTFDQAALEAVRQWRYAPTIVDGVVRAERTEMPVVIPPPSEGLTR